MKKVNTKCHVYCASCSFHNADKEKIDVHFVTHKNVVFVKLVDNSGGYSIYDVYFYVPDKSLFADVYFSVFNNQFIMASLLSCLSQKECLLLFCEAFNTQSYLIPVWGDGSFHVEDYLLALKKGESYVKKDK